MFCNPSVSDIQPGVLDVESMEVMSELFGEHRKLTLTYDESVRYPDGGDYATAYLIATRYEMGPNHSINLLKKAVDALGLTHSEIKYRLTQYRKLERFNEVEDASDLKRSREIRDYLKDLNNGVQVVFSEI